MQFGVIGSGSWATALAKILTDNGHTINWYVRNEKIINHIQKRNHNPNYLSTVYFDGKKLRLSVDVTETILSSDYIVIAIPSAYLVETLSKCDRNVFNGKKVVSAIKGILPENNLLLNEYLGKEFNFPIEDYFTVMGPCHAEEVAAEKLSYLTFSGINEKAAEKLSKNFVTEYLTAVVNNDVTGVQFAAILKNIYALGAGIAHGLEYGDNFLSVLIANCADEMAGFLQKAGVKHMEVGVHSTADHHKSPNYAASVYLGDLLVTCYSLFSRNRSFGNMIGKGYSVNTARLEMNMVAEGYNASKCIHAINGRVKADMPIADSIYKILWDHLPPDEGFKRIEQVLV
jgi:glycerol-3-phosphate dehydrogenase (NAD(P)+)